MKNKSRFTKIAVASGLIVASGAAVLGITGFASAELAPRNNTPAAVAPAADNNDNGGATDQSGNAGGTASAQATDDDASQAGLPGGDHAPFSHANTAKALGLSETDLETQLQTKSFATIAKEQGKDIADVKTAILADLKAHLDEEVKSGEHTQAEADAKLAQATANIDTFVNNVGRPRGMGGDHGPGGMDHGAPRFATDALAKVLKLSTADLNTQLQSGKTLADIAKAQNVDIADVKAQLLKDFTDKETAEVATGEHTQAEVDAKIADFKTHLDDMVNGVRPAGGPGMGHDGHGRGHGHGDGPMGDGDGDGPMGMGGQNGGPLGGTTQSSNTQNASFSA